jgi:putative ABC transport system substrate-binding protein
LALAAPRILLAQAPKRVYRIATLDDAVESARSSLWALFRNRLREAVLKDGMDVAYESRYASGAAERLAGLAAELVALKPDLIAVVSTPAALAVIKATSQIPVVFIGVGDPVGSGIVASLARPGGNATGTSIRTPEVAGKWFELLREIAPGAKRFAYLADAQNKAAQSTLAQLLEHAGKMGATMQMLDGRRRADLERSFEILKRDRVQGLIVSASALLVEHRDQILRFVSQNRLPTVYGRRDYVEAGGLLSYSAVSSETYVRGADYAHRILRGAKPADLPINQTSTLSLTLNLKTARALGLKIPPSLRLRADAVIE